jgi:uncharacterized membrane protein
MIAGIVLILIGLIALGMKMGLLPGTIWSNLWPILLIILGLSLLLKRRRRGFWCGGPWRSGPEDKDK